MRRPVLRTLSDPLPYRIRPEHQRLLARRLCDGGVVWSALGQHVDPDRIEDPDAARAVRACRQIAAARGTPSLDGVQLQCPVMESAAGKVSAEDRESTLRMLGEIEIAELDGLPGPTDAELVAIVGRVVREDQVEELLGDALLANGQGRDVAKLLQRAAEANTIGREGPTVPRRIGAQLGDVLTTLRRRADGTETLVPLPWPELAVALGRGLWPGLHMLVGGTKSGKSQLALQAILHAAQAGVPCLYVGLEMGPVDVAARLLALMHPKVRWSDLVLGFTSSELVEELAAAHADDLAALPIECVYGDPMAWDPRGLEGHVSRLAEEHGRPPLVVVDYLQVVGGGDRRADLRERIGAAAYECRRVARAHQVPMLVISSTRSRELQAN